VAATVAYKVARVLCRLYTTLRHDLHVTGLEHVPTHGGVIIASNHQSNLDPVLLGTRLHRPLSFLAKSELFENRYFGWLIRNLNAFPVRQGEGDVGAVKETIRRLQEGHAINIFPEGTRSRDGELQEILPGIALIVRRAGVPVVPAVIDGSYDAMPPGSKMIRPAPIRVAFGPAMNVAGLKGAQIVEKIDHTFHAMLADLRAREPVLQEALRRRHAR
jgi:1-acyl-sn-glycerol-3-phosphate acyltransferase